ncbi:U160 [Enterospora canceri]|uniref:U160 n=1 Tax=Enterospora canceri TaxID=1081671 RepID=A0A1Y1S5S0_9MICR|nr:U160 [Enterospora canceri]
MELFPNFRLIRTRDKAVIETGDIVYDVGFVCDPAANRYDHHMGWFNETFSPKYDIKLSSAGLIYKYFGTDVLEKRGVRRLLSDTLYDFIVDKVYRDIFLPADAIDNGYELPGGIRVRSIQDVVGSYNTNGGTANYHQKQDSRFHEALAVVRADLVNYLDNLCGRYVPKLEVVYTEMSRLRSTNIYVAEDAYDTQLIKDVEEMYEFNLDYMILPRREKYVIYCFTKRGKQFESKRPLKKEWRGKEGEELKRISGIEGIQYVHATGFTGAAETLEGAITMCRAGSNNSS